MDAHPKAEWLIPFLFSLNINVMADTITLKPSHPEQYTVLEGDTLWDIAGKFLTRPEQWTTLWQTNPQIKNPNLIYPGDLLVFSMEEGGVPSIRLGNRHASTVKQDRLSPKLRELPLHEAVPLIPSKKIVAYLSYPKVVSEDDIKNAPYVVGFVGEHLIAGSGDGVYVQGLHQSNNTNFTVYRQGATYSDADSGEILGYEAKYIANTVLQKLGEPSKLTINKARSEIHTGDRLIADAAEEITLNYFPRPPDRPVKGSIIGILDGVTQIGRYNIVAIDKGSTDGLKIGHVMDIYQRGRQISDPVNLDAKIAITLPDEMAGKLMVFRIFERVSYALIMQANTSIHLLDKVVTSE